MGMPMGILFKKTSRSERTTWDYVFNAMSWFVLINFAVWMVWKYLG
jgi:hypothetical protein